MYNPLNLNVNLNIAYEKLNVQGRNLYVHRRTGIFRPGGAVTYLPEKNYLVPKCKKTKQKKQQQQKKNQAFLMLASN